MDKWTEILPVWWAVPLCLLRTVTFLKSLAYTPYRLCFSFYQTPSAIDRFNTLPVKPSSNFVDVSRFTSSNSSLMTGRQSPVYVAVPVDRPPVKLRSKARITPQDTIDISAINDLRSKLLNVDDSGYDTENNKWVWIDIAFLFKRSTWCLTSERSLWYDERYRLTNMAMESQLSIFISIVNK